MRIFLSLFFLCISNIAFAQEEKNEFKGVEVYIKGGAHLSTILEPNYTRDFKLGVQTGFVSDFYVKDKIGVQLEMLYSTQGFSAFAGTVRMTYLNFPVLLNYEVSRLINIEVGPQFGWNVGNKSIFSNGSATNALLGFDLSACLGAKLDVAEQFSLQPRFSRSLNSLSDEGNFFHALASLSLLIHL